MAEATVTDTRKWQWWAGDNDEDYRLAGPCQSREEAINHAYGITEPGDTIHLIEAVAGEWDEFEGSFEFTHTRNASRIIREDDD